MKAFLSFTCFILLLFIFKALLGTKSMRVSGAYKEPLDRQIMERVQISNFPGPVLMNRRNEMGGIRIERTRYRRWGGDN